MALNINNTKKLLQEFKFQLLFIEELGWSNSTNKAIPFQTQEKLFYRKTIAELSGATVIEISSEDGAIPDSKTRKVISEEILKINFEHILIFIDKERTQSIWKWLKKFDKKNLSREHYFSRGQTGDAFITMLSNLLVDISEIENDLTISDVAKKISSALDVEKVTKRFFKEYEQQYIEFLPLISGIDDEADKRWYASVILNRLMFIYFLQRKGFLDKKNLNYLYVKMIETNSKIGKDKYYSHFLNLLFFEGFAKPVSERTNDANNLLGQVKYLNGGLFLKHQIEERYPNIKIPDIAFENLLRSVEPKGLFERFSWSLDDTPGGKDDEINPSVLGYIFEKYINQKEFGAYYTCTEITDYLCEQTVNKLILDAINADKILSNDKTYFTLEELLLDLNTETCTKLVYGNDAVLTNLSLLDPACGSGAFLVAAMKALINVYSSILGRIDFLGDKKLLEWKEDIQKNHPSINYFIKKKIITSNLYGVDVMEEATEIAKLRLFLALISSADKEEDLEPLPNIDFNIMCGNSLLGMMRVDPNKFNNHYNKQSNTISGKIVKRGNLFEQALIQGNMFSEDNAKNYQQIINDRENAVSSYKSAKNLTISDLHALRNKIQEQEHEATDILNRLLVEDFQNLSIPYTESTWDNEKKSEGKSIKRPVKIKDIEDVQPFHWGYEFSEIFRKKDGFDAIITNPPWETFQPNAREFLMAFSSNITKKKMDIKEFEKELESLMDNDVIKSRWLKYKSDYSHLREYYRISKQYVNQVPIIDGRRHGKDVNLYKLFVEQSYNLLKKNGYCGIVIPSGIYSDLGSKKLRELLFENSQITGIFGFENKKEIFEGVHRSFKFVVLSFEKGGKTKSIPTAFMKHDVKDLVTFPQHGSINLSLDFVKKQSPDSLSIMEIKEDIDFKISAKLLNNPSLSDKNADWHLILHREFNMTDDAHLFEKRPNDDSLPLYEGKMINILTNQFSGARYWIDEANGRASLLGKQTDEGQILGYQKYRLAYRTIGRNTDSRTLITTIIPPSFTGNSLNVSENLDPPTQIYCVGFLSSFVVDWYIRKMVGANVNMFYIYQIPVPRLKQDSKLFKKIIEVTLKIICINKEYAELWEEITSSKWDDSNILKANEKNELHSYLDAIIAHSYGLNEDEFNHILSTFPIINSVQKELAIINYRKLAIEFKINPPLISQELLASTSFDQTMKEFSLDEGIYSIRDVVQLSKMTLDKVTRWFKDLSKSQYEGLSGIQQSDVNSLRISFHGLIELVVIDELRKNNFTLKQILQARTDLKQKTNKLYPFATNNVRDNMKIVGKSLIFRFPSGDVTLNGSSQYNLSIIQAFFKNIEFDTEGLALRMFPLTNSKLITIDPKFGGGKAVISGKGVWAETIASAYVDLDSIPILQDQFDINKDEILAALEFCN